jgi:glycosyltransferase involved in cell wall biosynthesis
LQQKGRFFMQGILFTKYGNRAASTRQRFLQTFPYLQEEGIVVDVCPLLDNDYLDARFSGQTIPRLSVINAYLRRFTQVLKARRYDFIWVHYELFPYLPGFFERLAKIGGKPLIVDYDDATFHQYDHHTNWLVRMVLGEKLGSLLRRAQLACCGNPYLQEYVAKYCERSVIIPTTVDTEDYLPATGKDTSKEPVIGWVGSPSTWEYAAPILPVIRQFTDRSQAVMHAVGSGLSPSTNRAGLCHIPWEEDQEVMQIQHMDIGIMPLRDDPWARGKCGYKLIQYMACGLPVIASPVGVNAEIVEHGVNGFLASTKEEWFEALQKLIENPKLRAEMGRVGREKVEKQYSLQVYGPRVAQLIQELCGSSTGV